MLPKTDVSIVYSHIADGTELVASEAGRELAIEGRMCTVIRHRMDVRVEYLIELPSGERKWVGESQE